MIEASRLTSEFTFDTRPLLSSSILDSPLSTLYFYLHRKPATRFELVSTAYETSALPIELRRQFGDRGQI